MRYLAYTLIEAFHNTLFFLFLAAVSGFAAFVTWLVREDEDAPTSQEAVVLHILMERGESYGLHLVRASGGKLHRGSVYVLLGKMEERGFVRSYEEDEARPYVGIKRRLYVVTGHGKIAYTRHCL